MPTIAANQLPDTTGRDLGSPSQRWDLYANLIDVLTTFTMGNGAVQILWGMGDPSVNAVVANQGSIFLRTDGDDSHTLYVKTGSDDTSWTAYALLAGGTLNANLIGNVTGNVTGDLTGNVTGDVTGNVTGTLTGATSLLAPLPTDQGGTGQNSTATFPTSGTLITADASANLTNKDLVVASSGNNVSLLNQQSAIAPIAGNSTDLTLFTYTLPANYMGAGKGVRVTVGYRHSTGSGSVEYKLWLGATALADWTSSATTANSIESMIFNNSSATNAQNALTTGATVAQATAAIDTTANAVIKATFNGASSESVTGLFWLVELIQ